ncbi:AAA domain-containing protein [Ureaplasma ceti]|uniref:ATP-binding protein n=1 Tax=Ureaplasma ceti TaxID=3119530 RepID=A0ABP9UBF9_9BACT
MSTEKLNTLDAEANGLTNNQANSVHNDLEGFKTESVSTDEAQPSEPHTSNFQTNQGSSSQTTSFSTERTIFDIKREQNNFEAALTAMKTEITPPVVTPASQFNKKTLSNVDINYKVSVDEGLFDENDFSFEVKTGKAIKSKLANMTAANPRDLCIKAKITKDTVDLSKYFEHEALLQFFRDNDKTLSFSKNLGASDTIDRLSKAQNLEEFMEICNEEEITITERRQADLTGNFDKYKIKVRDEVASQTESQQKKFNKIVKDNDVIVENTGVHSLYVAYNFLVGTTRKGTSINAPLIFFPVTLESENNEPYKMYHLKNGFQVNEKLLTLLKKEYDLDWVIADLSKINNLEKLIKIIRNGIKSTFVQSSYENHEFRDYTASEFSKLTFLNLYDSAILGIFEPSGGALKDNLENLVDNDIDPFVSNKEYSDIKFVQEEIDAIPLLEIGRPLNIYQKYAVRSALSQNTLIYGPPGTGKSEVIASIIANVISLNKSVLVVSEKKAALDVLHERLQNLSDLALFIYDLDNKKAFYDKIADFGDKINNMRLEGFEPQDYNLRGILETQEKWTHVDNSHKALRQHIWQLVELNNKLDSNGTNFSDYLVYRSRCDDKIVQYAKESKVIEYIGSIMDRYFFENVDKLMNKFNEYKDFLLTYGLDEPGISERLKKEKVKITELQVADNLLEYLIQSESKIKYNVQMFKELLQEYKLDKDERFLRLLKGTPNLLKQQQTQLKNFIKKYSDLLEGKFLEFLVKNYDELPHFINKLELTKEEHKFYVASKFFTTGKVLKLQPVFSKPKVMTDAQKRKIEAVKEFMEIPEARYRYLPVLLKDNVNYIDKNTVHFYLNDWLLNSYIIDLGVKQFTFFDDDVLVKLNPVRNFNSKIYNEYKLLINYDNEVMSKYTGLMGADFNQLVNRDRDQVLNATKDASRQIEHCFIDYLKNRLVRISPLEKERMQQIFSIARRGGNNSSIKDFVQEYYKELSIIFPIWISLPELVAQIFPLKSGLFDYGIFDEASQMFVERAYPLVYRCKTSIVAGDDKQLKPTSFFASRISNNNNYELNDNDVVDSLLDRAKVSLWSAYNLRNHYRSTHRDLIQFSNDYIYDHKLHFATKNGSTASGIEVINANGIAEDSTNQREVDLVIDKLEENINLYNKIIVITFGVKQSLLIEQTISKMGPALGTVFQKYEDGRLVITNLENVQGNEGDLVILSVTYGKNKDGYLRNGYGPLIMDGGINRLNVAITRAKEKMIIIKSLYSKDMNVNLNNKNAVVFKSFIQYCDQFGSDNINAMVKDITPTPMLNESFRTDVQQYLESILKDRDIDLVQNYDIGSKVIDFALINPKNKEIITTFILQPWSRDVTTKEYLEDIDNYYFLKDRGYKVNRIEEYMWTYNKANVQADIASLIDDVTMSKPKIIVDFDEVDPWNK